MKINLIRHGKTIWNVEERYIGRTDLSLCEIGIADLTEKWQGKEPNCEFIYSSPMKRCLETVKVIFQKRNFKIENKIHERDFGIFEGKNYNELKNDKNFIDFIDSKGMAPIEGVENRENFEKRVHEGIINIVNEVTELGGDEVCVITHGGVIMHLLSAFSLQGGTIFDYRVENGGGYITEFNINDGMFNIITKISN